MALYFVGEKSEIKKVNKVFYQKLQFYDYFTTFNIDFGDLYTLFDRFFK